MDGNSGNKVMKKVFDEVATLDKKCYDKYGLSEDILMEHAATAMLNFIESNFDTDKSVLIVSGVGNNGADGIALARLLQGGYSVNLYLPFGVKSEMAKLQLKRAQLAGVNIIDDNQFNIQHATYNIIVDCLFGSGLSRPLNDKATEIIEILNAMDGYKIACDIPSGILKDPSLVAYNPSLFKAETTITMGALKTQTFGDMVKDFVGDIIVANLGVQRELYENEANNFLLEKSDMKLPVRKSLSTHKGNFGHLVVILGDKIGAGLLCSEAGFAFGAGLVTTTGHQDNLMLPHHIMQSHSIPKNATAIAIGMGLGNHDNDEINQILKTNIAKVIDADLFHDRKILTVLNSDNVVLTPHAKEFCSLLKICDIAQIDVNELQNNRFKYLKAFNEKYPNIVLLLKGANTLIGYQNKIYINSYGSSVLSKGGSGDILSGMIGSLLAQGYSALDSAVTATLAHSIAALNYSKNNYSLTPEDLIEEIKKL